MMNKSIYTPLLALLLALALVACSPAPDPGPPVKLETGQAASIVIGQDDFTSDFEPDDSKAFSSVYGTPLVNNGVLYLPDYEWGRVMGYLEVPSTNGAAADFVLGKVDFDDSNGLVSPTTFSGPQSLFTDGSDLYIADYNHSRIVRYDGFPTTSGAAAVFAIGQLDLNSAVGDCTATNFENVESATIAGGRLIVADSGNNRVLIWNTVPTVPGVPADIVLGQPDMTTCDNPASPLPGNLDYPSDVWSDGTRLLVADSDQERVLLWNTFPTTNAQAPDVVLGQPDFVSDDYGDAADQLSYPYFLTSNGTQIAVADTSNNRILIWNTFPTENGTPADVVLGQTGFNKSDENGGAAGPTATGLDYPTGVLFYGNMLIVGDNDNDRYLIYKGL